MSPQKTFYMSLRSTKNLKENIKNSLKTTEVIPDADGHIVT